MSPSPSAIIDTHAVASVYMNAEFGSLCSVKMNYPFSVSLQVGLEMIRSCYNEESVF